MPIVYVVSPKLNLIPMPKASADFLCFPHTLVPKLLTSGLTCGHAFRGVTETRRSEMSACKPHSDTVLLVSLFRRGAHVSMPWARSFRVVHVTRAAALCEIAP